jgi:hypothetical protein
MYQEQIFLIGGDASEIWDGAECVFEQQVPLMEVNMLELVGGRALSPEEQYKPNLLYSGVTDQWGMIFESTSLVLLA